MEKFQQKKTVKPENLHSTKAKICQSRVGSCDAQKQSIGGIRKISDSVFRPEPRRKYLGNLSFLSANRKTRLLKSENEGLLFGRKRDEIIEVSARRDKRDRNILKKNHGSPFSLLEEKILVSKAFHGRA